MLLIVSISNPSIKPKVKARKNIYGNAGAIGMKAINIPGNINNENNIGRSILL